MRLASVSGRSGLAILLILVIGVAGCAALQPPSPNGPGSTESAYPLVYSADDVRRNAVTSAVSRFVQPPNPSAEPNLQPVTLTIEQLRPNPGHPLYLPKLGTGAVMTEDETRESLRRFIKEWQDLIGSDPARLSLVARTDQPNGTKLATYEQRPFRYPIRGNFGKLEINFTGDRRVVAMSSTCIPDADKVQTALAANPVKLKPEDVVSQLVSSPIIVPGGLQPAFSVQPNQITPRELVTYVRPSQSNPDVIELRLAWEVEVRTAAVKTVYVDAVNGAIIAAE